MIRLPIDEHLPTILPTLQRDGAIVLVAAPGAGKTTRVPPALVNANLPSNGSIIMLQPRRIAARASATRIAEEQNWTLGGEVGYQVRFERKMRANTRIKILTEAILTRMIIADPFLEGVGAVILDEFHERSIHSDLALALLRDIRANVRPDLLLIVMSATLDADAVAKYLACDVCNVPGRLFPIDMRYTQAAQGMQRNRLPEQVETALHDLLDDEADDNGDVLVFLPGVAEINRTQQQLASLARQHDLNVLPLHGSLPFEQQALALKPADRRKVVLATNVAETSLTIEGVTAVIDTGLAREASFDQQRGVQRLGLRRISRASADQRAGRAGRTAPGRCMRLWSKPEDSALAAFDAPEVQRIDLAPTLLTLYAWGVRDPAKFTWLNPPSDAAITSADRLLHMLDAVNDDGTLSDIGQRLTSLPTHPRVGRLLLAAESARASEHGAAMAALLDEPDLLTPRRSASRGPSGRGSATRARSDLLAPLDALINNKAGQLDAGAFHRARQSMQQLLRLISTKRASAARSEDDLLRLLLHAYPDRVCRRRTRDDRTARMVGGAGVKLAEESAVHDAELFIALQLRLDDRSASREALVTAASAVELDWLLDLPAAREHRELRYDPQREAVIASVQTRLGDLVLKAAEQPSGASAEAQQALADALTPEAESIFRADEKAALLLARVALLREHMPERGWPSFDADMFADLLQQAAAGRWTRKQLIESDLHSLLLAQLLYPLPRILDVEAPLQLTLPNGKRGKIVYEEGKPPVLATRLQDLFGWRETPTIANGRCPLLLHLLAPNFRPVQVTEDLASFWENTYPQVRKDLRARYPKHKWPEDPT